MLGTTIHERANRLTFLPLLLWLLVTKLLAQSPVFNFLLDPLRDLCDGSLQAFSVCRRLRSRAYDIGVPLSDLSLDHFFYLAMVVSAFFVLTLLVVRVSGNDLRDSLRRLERSRLPSSPRFYAAVWAFLAIGSFALFAFDVIPSFRLPRDLNRHLCVWISLIVGFQSMFWLRASRYTPPEPPVKLEPTSADYWEKRE